MRRTLLAPPQLRGWIVGIALLGALFGAAALVLSGPAGGSNVIQLAGDGSAGGHVRAPSGAVTTAPDGATELAARQFAIAGSVAGLYPGRSLPLVLTVSNSRSYAITVTSIRTVVLNASSLCTASNVKVTKFVGKLYVRAKKTAKATVTVSMAHAAVNACQGARFPFHYAGLGRRG
jgi:hypothetical protein